MQNQGGYGELQTTVSSFDLSTGMINWSYTGNFVFPSRWRRVCYLCWCHSFGFSALRAECDERHASLHGTDSRTGELDDADRFPDPVSGNVTAFIAEYSQVSAVSLGLLGGSVLWTQIGQFGGDSIPTVVDDSIILAGPYQYYAFNRTTGAANHFWSGGIAGGGGTTVAYDAARQQFYVREFYGYFDQIPTLSAYHYTDNAHITLLWQRTGEGIDVNGSVAIGPTGKVYSAGNIIIWELDPATGATLRSIPGSFATGVTPALTDNVLWIITPITVAAYDLTSLQFLQDFNRLLGPGTAYKGPGAFADGYFVLDYGNIVFSHSFDVYRAPTPTPTPTPCTGRCEPTPRPRPTPAPRP